MSNSSVTYTTCILLTFLAGDLRVARVSLRAVAERRVLEDAAVGVAAAVARVDAVAVQARLLLRALPVHLTPHDDGLGCYIEKRENVNKRHITAG